MTAFRKTSINFANHKLLCTMIIKSILDTDLYKFTTSYAYIKLFPYAMGTFTFIDRDETRYNDEFVRSLRDEVDAMSRIRLTESEIDFMLGACRFLPRMDDVEERAIERGAAHTSFSRRLVAFAVDMAVTAVVLAVLRFAFPAADDTAAGHIGLLMGATGIAFMLVPLLTRGQTVGHRAVGLRVVRPDGTTAPGISYIVRYGLLFWVFLLLPSWVAALFPAAGSPVLHLGDEVSISSAGISAVLFSVYVTWVVTIAARAVRSAFKHPFVMLNGIISNTRIMSVAQADRLRTARHEETLAEELHELDIDPLGTDLDDAFDSSFDTTSADEGVDFDPEEQGHI